MTEVRKKLIEVALPLKAINEASELEKQPFTRKHPRSLHIWWARRPFVAARAVIFAQMVDDPSSWPDLFPTEKKQQKERERLFGIIEELVRWGNTANTTVLDRARDEIWQSWRRACAEHAGHLRARELFDRHALPAFYDPFAGGGALPVEAQRLGLAPYASDLNPVAVLINKVMIEIPPLFAGRAPVNPEWQRKSREEKALSEWRGAKGLAEDVRYYGSWMRDEAERRIGRLYPPIDVTAEMASARPDLKPYVGQRLTVIAWLWARTVRSPNPAYAKVDVPLASTFMLSTKAGKEAYIEPVVESGGYRFTVKVGKPSDPERAKRGTKLSRGANFECLMSGTPIGGDYIKAEGMAGRLGARLMAIVAEGQRGRVYLPPTVAQELVAREARPDWRPELPLAPDPRALWTPAYGLKSFADLFSARQLVALSTFSDLVGEVTARVRSEALAAGVTSDTTALSDGGVGALAYAEAVSVYMACATSRWSDLSNTICSWNTTNQNVRALFARQGIPMSWDYCELSPFSRVGSWFSVVESSVEAAESLPATPSGRAEQADAANQKIGFEKVVSTDPPYYDNIGYADLSDFFYVWLRRALRGVYPDLFATVAVPKAQELVATPYRHGSKDKAEAFFLDGMTQAMRGLAAQAHPAFPVTIYYAFKQSESESDIGTASTGWETFLDAVIRAGFGISGTWPMRTERGARSISIGTNALASSIVLVCRTRSVEAPTATRREFVLALKSELPTALRHLQDGNIAPVDLAQAAIGPGMAVYTRYAKVLGAEGESVPVREALALINRVLDETLAEQEGDFDAETRLALAWFEQFGFNDGPFGEAETLSKAKNASIQGMTGRDGFLESQRGRVRLRRPKELLDTWEPTTGARVTHWETVHHLIRVLEKDGEAAAGALVAKLGAKAEVARELAYRLYTLCERKKRASEALAYNALVQSFPEITRLAREGGKAQQADRSLFEAGEE